MQENNKLKVLLCSPLRGIGGISIWTSHILNYLKANNTNVIVKQCFSDNKHQSLGDTNLIIRIINAFFNYIPLIRLLKKEIKNDTYDIVHLTTSASISLIKDIILLKICRRKRIKSIIHFHFGRIPELASKKNWEWKMLCKVISLSDTAIVLDKVSYKTLLAANFRNIALLPNPIAPKVLEIISNNKNKIINKRSLLFVGHCVPTKGVYELIDACNKISNIKLKLVGNISNKIREDLQDKTNNAEWLDITGVYSFEDTIKEMLSCEVFVLPTYSEGFPNVILESMACGCAIVTTPVGAIPEMLEEENDQQYGIMVEPKNVDELKDAIEKMLSDENLKNECRKNVQQRVNERYNIDVVWKQMINIWNRTIN